MEQRRQRWRIVGSVLIGGLVGVAALQLHALETRLSTQSQQLRMLGEATERMAVQLERIRGGASVAERAGSAPSGATVLHPEVKDFLAPRDIHWPPPGAKTNGVIAVDWFSGDPKGFNPIVENYSDLPDKLANYIESRLIQRNAWTNPDTYYGDLAWRVEALDNFKHFVVYLRKGVKWHPASGVDLTNPRYAWLNKEHLLTAHDFTFMFDMITDPQVQNGFLKNYYEELESWKALDDYTLEIKWKKSQALNVEYSVYASPLPRFLYAFNEDGTPIPEGTVGLALNQHWYNNKGLVGTGPYRFAEYTPGVQIRLERNEDYYDELPAIKSVRYSIYTDRTQTVLKLKSGELSFGTLRAGQYREEVLQYLELPPEQRPKNSPFLDGTITCDVVDHPAYYYIGWNQENPIFKDRRVRRAMTLALNRQELVEKVFSGLGRISRGPFMETGPYLAPEIQPLPFDLKQAAALLKEAGWVDSDGDGLLDNNLGSGPRTPFHFTLMIYPAPEWANLANIYKEDLLSIGVKIDIEAVEWSHMLKRWDERKFDAYTGAWSLLWSTDPYQIWHSSQADVPKGSNRVGFRNKQADALIDELRGTLDPGKRTELLRAVHRIIHEEQPYTFIYTPKFPQCHRQEVKGVIYSKVRPVPDFQPWWSTRVDG
jgi:peptide/nickel transport system substrate-binding protein